MRRSIFLSISLIINSLVLQGINASPNVNTKGQNYAIFFANDDYDEHPAFSNLKNPIRDAKSIADELKTQYGFEIFIFENFTRSKIFSALEKWQQYPFEKEDQLFIFFSGHGSFWEFTEKGYFIPKDAKEDYFDYIQLIDLANIIAKFSCPHILLGIDACYSGTIKAPIPDDPQMKDQLATNRKFILTTIEEKQRLPFRMIITSGSNAQTPDGVEHSPFANAILESLKEGSRNKEILTITDLLEKLEKIRPIPQFSYFNGHQVGGDFIFKFNKKELIDPLRPFDKSTKKPQEEISLPSNFIEDKDGNIYSFTKMKDGMNWLSQNLNLDHKNSFCPFQTQEYCNLYGRLYSWDAAKEACSTLGPNWQLPSNEDWLNLIEAYGGDIKNVWGYMALQQTVKDMQAGDKNSFKIQYAGVGYDFGNVNEVGSIVYYWTRDKADAGNNNFVETYEFINPGNVGRRKARLVQSFCSVKCIQKITNKN